MSMVFDILKAAFAQSFQRRRSKFSTQSVKKFCLKILFPGESARAVNIPIVCVERFVLILDGTREKIRKCCTQAIYLCFLDFLSLSLLYLDQHDTLSFSTLAWMGLTRKNFTLISGETDTFFRLLFGAVLMPENFWCRSKEFCLWKAAIKPNGIYIAFESDSPIDRDSLFHAAFFHPLNRTNGRAAQRCGHFVSIHLALFRFRRRKQVTCLMYY